MDDRTVPETLFTKEPTDGVNPLVVQAIMNALGNVVAQGTANQTEGVRAQVEGQVRLAEIQSAQQIKLAELNIAAQATTGKRTLWVVGVLAVCVTALVSVAVIKDRFDLALQLLAIVGTSAATWFAAKAKQR